MQPLSRVIVAGVLFAVLASGCGGTGVVEVGSGPDAADDPAEDPEPSGDDPPVQDDLGGFGAPAAAPGEFEPSGTVALAGTVQADDRGCWRLEGEIDGALLVLPPGFELGASGDEVLTGSGEALPSGTPVEARGALVGVEELPGGPDGRWASYLGVCDPDTAVIVVAEQLDIDRFDAEAWDDADLVDQLETVTLDTHWPCGYGFAVSDAEQRVGLYLEPTTGEPPSAGPVSLPDERFAATVVIGNQLFANHCDDVLEWFEPQARRLVEWPVTAGSFDYQPGEDTGSCDGGGPVTATLTDAVVTTPSGDRPLPPLELVNDAFGCFAG